MIIIGVQKNVFSGSLHIQNAQEGGLFLSI